MTSGRYPGRRQVLRGIAALASMPLASRSQQRELVPSRLASVPGESRQIRVGATGDVRTLAEASKISKDGDTVLVEGGDYRGDVAVWTQRGLTIRGIGDRPRLIADGKSAEGKAIFVVRGDCLRVENIAFSGARVRDRNGAGIRLERGRLEVARCHFEDNENGILTANDSSVELSIDRTSFVDNGAGDGRSHNLYAGTIGRLVVSSSYFARSRVGHLLKSRARETLLMYSRLSGENGTSSYELEFPNGGLAVVLGCLIQQGPRSQNATIVSYGAEGYRWPRNDLQIAYSTLVNDRRPGAKFVRVAPGKVSVAMFENLLVGVGAIDVGSGSALMRNRSASRSDFADASKLDFRPKATSKHFGALGKGGVQAGAPARPEREYEHPADSVPLPPTSDLMPLSPGAFQRAGD